MTFYEELQWRGLVNQISSPELIEKLNKGGMTFYIGTDPTADSLHLGHYSSFLITRRMQRAGHTPILLVGLATGLIGDPRGTVERELKQKQEVIRNYEALKAQVERLFGFEVVNNYDWIKELNVIDFFRDYGKYINVGYMLTKDHVRRQMESGISYAEFSYMLIQAIDFKHLHETRGVDLQVAGSDQWGNITTGIELIRKTTGDEVYALTMPLVTDSQGNKFGKSEGNALWLDKEKTSPYELYQFLINTEDSCVISYLKRLTFLTPEHIMQIEAQHAEHPEQRIAQKALAREIITDLHGEEEYSHAVEISEKLFAGDFKSLSLRDIKAGMKNVPHVGITPGPLADVLVGAGICSSKREAREFIGNGAISINGEVVKDPAFTVDAACALERLIDQLDSFTETWNSEYEEFERTANNLCKHRSGVLKNHMNKFSFYRDFIERFRNHTDVRNKKFDHTSILQRTIDEIDISNRLYHDNMQDRGDAKHIFGSDWFIKNYMPNMWASAPAEYSWGRRLLSGIIIPFQEPMYPVQVKRSVIIRRGKKKFYFGEIA